MSKLQPKKSDIKIERLDPTGVVIETITLCKRTETDYQRFLITIDGVEYMMTPAEHIRKIR